MLAGTDEFNLLDDIQKTSHARSQTSHLRSSGTRRNWKNYGHGSGHDGYGGRFGCEMPRSHAQGQKQLDTSPKRSRNSNDTLVQQA
jgi:hypothetical protein